MRSLLKIDYRTLMVWLCVSATQLISQTDNCIIGSSTLLTPGAVFAGCSTTAGNTTTGFTNSNQGCTAGNKDDDCWYRFVATATSHTITVDGGADMDPVLGVYTNCSGGQPAGGGCVDATGTNGIETSVVTGLTVGVTYYICVHDYAPGGGNFTICITTGAPTINMTNGSTTTCGNVFMDNGGTGNYSNSQNLVYTFCPSTAGQCITAAFTAFDLEDNFDYLSVFDGNSTAAPMLIGSSYSPSSPGTIRATTTNATGCLTFRFSSDGATTASGWSANITCGSCGTPPAVVTQQDCLGANTICNNQSVTGVSLGSGSFNDVNIGLGNSGCLNDYATNPNGSAEHQSHWYYFSPSASGNIGMTIAPSVSTTDYDWAIWGPFSTLPCPPTTAPIRCSAASAAGSAGGATGLGNGAADTDEGSGGNGWLATLNVVAGQKYILLLDNWNATSAPYTLSWQLGGGASLNCSVLPIELLSFTGSHKTDHNLIEWITATEKDNDFFTIERSIDGINWEEIHVEDGAGNTTTLKSYNYKDRTFKTGDINYYRLKQTDFNGQYNHSQIISIETPTHKDELTNVYPNPTTSDINFNVFTESKSNLIIEFIDANGTVIYKSSQMAERGNNQTHISINQFKNGIYLLKVTIENTGNILIHKVIKN